jgi:OOP family OmpA-OmpF porin
MPYFVQGLDTTTIFVIREDRMTNKSWMPIVVAAAALAFSATSFNAGAQSESGSANWTGSGGAWKNSAGQCWRAGYWTPAMATAECDPDLVKKPEPVVAPRQAPPPPPPPVVAPAPAPKPKPVAEKITFAADVLFDFDKASLKPEGKSKLDDLAGKVKDINLEVVIAIGHTDSIGSDAYNQKLSVRRAEAVKAYLVSKGIEPNRIYTEGKGEKQPVASNKTADGRQKNRRVEIEVIGTRKN